MLIRSSAVLAVFIALTVPAQAAATPSKLTADQLAAIKTIGIISAVGDTLSIGTNGPLLRFSMSQRVQPISDLEIDSLLEQRMTERLGERFKIEPVKYDREQFSKVEDRAHLTKRDLPPVEKLIKSLSTPVDAYLVISKDVVPFWLGGFVGLGDGGPIRPGLNIGRGGFHEDQYVADALVTVSVIDARSSTVLAQVGYPPPVSEFWGCHNTCKRLSFDAALWPDDAGQFTDTQRNGLKNFFADDLTLIVDGCVEQLGLAPAPAGDSKAPSTVLQ